MKVHTIILMWALAALAGPLLAVEEELPPVWAKAHPQAHLQALGRAEMDARRNLAERIIGVQIAGHLNSADLLEDDSRFESFTKGTLRGVREVTDGYPRYDETGMVTVKYRVPIETVREAYVANLPEHRAAEVRKQLAEASEVKWVEAEGYAALPGTEGLGRVRAYRAALIDAQRKMAGTLLGVRLDARTEVRDFVLDSDQAGATFTGLIKGLRPVEPPSFRHGFCTVKVNLKKVKVMQTIVQASTYVDGRLSRKEIERAFVDLEVNVFEVVGRGATKDGEPAATPAEGAETADLPLFRAIIRETTRAVESETEVIIEHR